MHRLDNLRFEEVYSCLPIRPTRDRHRPFCPALVDMSTLVFDPRTVSSYQIALDDRNSKARMNPLGIGTPYRGNDWVLVIDDVDKAYAEPGVPSEVE